MNSDEAKPWKMLFINFFSHGSFQSAFYFTHVTVACCIVSDAEIVQALFTILTEIVAIMDADVRPTIAEDTNSGISTLFPSFERAFSGL